MEDGFEYNMLIPITPWQIYSHLLAHFDGPPNKPKRGSKLASLKLLLRSPTSPSSYGLLIQGFHESCHFSTCLGSRNVPFLLPWSLLQWAEFVLPGLILPAGCVPDMDVYEGAGTCEYIDGFQPEAISLVRGTSPNFCVSLPIPSLFAYTNVYSLCDVLSPNCNNLALLHVFFQK